MCYLNGQVYVAGRTPSYNFAHVVRRTLGDELRTEADAKSVYACSNVYVYMSVYVGEIGRKRAIRVYVKQFVMK